MGITVINVLLGGTGMSGTSAGGSDTACIDIAVGIGDGTPNGGWHYPICLAAGPSITSDDRAALLAVRDAAIAAAKTSAAAWEAWITSRPAVPGGTTPSMTGAAWWAGIPASNREYVRTRIAWTLI